jgi:predicted PurR-regulated permease PerM
MRFSRAEKLKPVSSAAGCNHVLLVVVLLIISGLFYFIIPQLYESIESIVTNISDSIEKLQDWADKWLDNYPLIDQNFSEILQDISGSITKWAKDTLLPQMQEIISTVSTGVISFLRLLQTS